MCGYLAGQLPGALTFGRAIDDTLDLRARPAPAGGPARAGRGLLGRVPARPRGGYDELVDLAAGDPRRPHPDARRRPGRRAGAVVVRAGVRSCTWTGSGPAPGGSWRAYVDAGWSARGGCCLTGPLERAAHRRLK